MIDPMLNELRQEASTTRRVLERVPEDKLTWKPHPKSMSLGQLAFHLATIPGNISRIAERDEFDAAQANFEPPMPKNTDEILTAHDASVKAAETFIGGLTPQQAMANWRFNNRGKEVFTIPRVGVLRSILLNHMYHHRGQLSVYLRLIDVPVPVIYGRSADENPFA
jgi:uncharacterized damage-inducible protein DinB